MVLSWRSAFLLYSNRFYGNWWEAFCYKLFVKIPIFSIVKWYRCNTFSLQCLNVCWQRPCHRWRTVHERHWGMINARVGAAGVGVTLIHVWLTGWRHGAPQRQWVEVHELLIVVVCVPSCFKARVFTYVFVCCTWEEVYWGPTCTGRILWKGKHWLADKRHGCHCSRLIGQLLVWRHMSWWGATLRCVGICRWVVVGIGWQWCVSWPEMRRNSVFVDAAHVCDKTGKIKPKMKKMKSSIYKTPSSKWSGNVIYLRIINFASLSCVFVHVQHECPCQGHSSHKTKGILTKSFVPPIQFRWS